MAYDASDPRAALAPAVAPAAAAAAVTGPFTAAHYAKFYETPPQEEAGGLRTWYARGRNFIVAYSEVPAGATLTRSGQPDEYVLLLPDHGIAADVTAGAETKAIEGYSVTFIPPGDSRITITAPGRIVRLFTPRSEDLAAKCSNAAGFAEPDPRIRRRRTGPPADLPHCSYTLDVPKEFAASARSGAAPPSW